MVTTGSVFVGRQREMELLNAALEEALSGQGRLVMLVGEPGIGKTRTAQELAAAAGQRGAHLLWGRCYEQAGAPPYWPWVQSLRSYVQQRDEDQLRSEMGTGAADIAEIVPELREKLLGLAPPPALDSPEANRFRLFDSITRFLKNVAQSQPLVLVLDDLHWADQPSLLLLQFVARELGNVRALLLGAYRDVELSRRHPLSETLAQLSREAIFQRIPLQGLSREDTQPFIQATSGILTLPALAEAIHDRTEGNPFFMAEVVHLLSDQGGLAGQGAAGPQAVRIPEGVREAIGQRLNRLTEQCNQVLTTAAIIGREFSLDQLARLSKDLSEDRLLQVVEEGLAAGMIQELPGSAEDYQFAHALIQETLASELSAARRVRLHARIGQALEELYGPQAEAHAAELAHHFAQAESVLGPEKVVKYSLLAGERALAAFAWEEAEAHFLRGLVARNIPLEGTEAAMDDEAAALLFGLGRAQAATAERNRPQEAVDIMGRAFDYYEAAGDVAQAVAVAEYALPANFPGRSVVAQFIPRALKLVPPDSLQAGRLLSRYGNDLGRVENDYEGAQEPFRRALVIARREQDLALEVRTLAAAANVNCFHLRLPEALDKAGQAIELARGLDDPQAAWLPRLDTTRALWLMGEGRAAQQHALAALDLAEKLRYRYRLGTAFQTSIRLYRHLGDWPRARELSDRGLAAAQDDNLLADRVLLEYQLGDFDSGEAYLKRLLETRVTAGVHGVRAQVIAWVARITGALDRLDVAEAAAQTILSSPFANPYFVNYAKAGLGLLAVLRGDGVAAAEQYEALEPRRGLVLLEISSDHLLGLLSHTMGDLDQAGGHFEDALAFSRKAGYRPELAWSLCDYADLLLAPSTGSGRAAPENRQKAMSLLDESLAISSELGMKPLMERVLALRERADSLPTKGPAYPDGLTQREVEVVRLVAVGKSNLEIGEALFISTNTVAHHVTNILNKSGAANRTEAAAYATRQGLV